MQTRIYVYKHRNKWKVEVRRGGERTTQTVPTKEEADAIAAEARTLIKGESVSAAELVDEYVADLKTGGLRESHTSTVRYRLTKATGDLLLADLTPRRCEKLYDEMTTFWAVDTHRGALSCLKTWGRWLVRQKYLAASPFEHIEGKGKRKKGKAQLTIDEARRLMGACLDAPVDDVGATMVLCCLVLGLRAGEVAGLEPRSIDDGGRILRVLSAKTEAGVRAVEVPEMLRGRMPALASAEGKNRQRVGYAVRKWAKLAGVPHVSPHGLRGTHATLATRAGATSQLVAGTLGHSSTAVTEAHYTRAEAVQEQEQAVRLQVLVGGRR